MLERRKRELKPVLKVLEEVKKVEEQEETPETKAFLESVNNLSNIVGQADKFLDIATRAERGWFFNTLIRMFSRTVKPEKE